MIRQVKFNSLLVCVLLGSISILFLAASVYGEEIPKGKIEQFQYSASKIFPGTVRQVTVYIPVQIDKTKPACVHVQQDGFNPTQGINNILDTLIAKKEIPVTVGVFIQSGSLPSPDGKTLDRPNRSFEYNVVGDNYVRFLIEEILPYVAQKYGLNLSKNGNDRSIGGGSSGGIAAFSAAWERPDAFSRVYCSSGSFVAFSGGNEFPVLIRKTEAKPIRAFLITGNKDMENCSGDWTLVNEEMDKALKFSGYDYCYKLLDGGHVVGWKENFAAGMRYLWKDWPEQIKPGTGAPRVRDIILPGESWKIAGEGFKDARGPACSPKGEIYFTDPESNKIYKIGLDGHITVFIENGGNSNGLSFGSNGDLFSVSSLTGKILSYDAKGKSSIYADGIYGQYVLARPDGGLYVSGRIKNDKSSKVWLVKDGAKTEVGSGLNFPSGIAMSPDRWLLAVADNQSHWVYSYQINADGKLINKERFFWLYRADWDEDSGAESVCYDREGHLYVATRAGIQVCAWDGPLQVILPLPNGRVKGICIGGADFDTLFAFCSDKIYKRKIKNHTVGAFTPWTIMTRGKL